MRRVLAWPELVPAVLLILAYFAGTRESSYFQFSYLLGSTTTVAETGLMIAGMIFVIVCGEIDLSVASNLALVACVTAKLAEKGNLPLAIAGGLIVGGLLGAFNGLLIAYGKLPSFLVTLGTFALFRGAAQALVGSESVALPPKLTGVDTIYLPYPLPATLVLVLVVALGLGIVLHRTVFGRWVYATGSSEQAARYSSVPTAQLKFWIFVLSGFLAGIGGILMDSRLGVARFDHGQGLELDVITATVLGGASIYGGKGSMLGSVLAFFMIYFVRAGLGLANVSADYQLAIVGTLLVVAVGLNMIGKKR